jgi:hypothetical protein
MPRQAERTKPTTFDSFTDVRISTSSSLESASQHASIFTTEDDLDDDTRDRLGLLRSDEQGDCHNGTTAIMAAGGGMRQGKPFTLLSSSSSHSLPISGVINSNPDQIQQQTDEILAAQALDKLSANLGRL